MHSSVSVMAEARYAAMAPLISKMAPMPHGLGTTEPSLMGLMRQLDRALFHGEVAGCAWTPEELEAQRLAEENQRRIKEAQTEAERAAERQGGVEARCTGQRAGKQ